MENYRGFAETFIPLPSATFLVGENSTGKTSFLFLADLLSKPECWFSAGSSQSIFSHLGGFTDIVSASSADKGSFTVGVFAMKSARVGGMSRNAKAPKEGCTFTSCDSTMRTAVLDLAHTSNMKTVISCECFSRVKKLYSRLNGGHFHPKESERPKKPLSEF
jgi:hypothetical protein